MPKDYSKQNLQRASFKNEDLTQASFNESDLRGADFSGSDLTGANLSHVRTGITLINVIWIFIVALLISAFSGYLAMLVWRTQRILLDSTDKNMRAAGIGSIVIIILFILFSLWKGQRKAIRYILIPVAIIAIIVGIVRVVSGTGTGIGISYLLLALVLVAIMFIVGTIARASVGSLSNILFVVVAVAGGMFGKTVGGGIASVIMAIGCALISKRALSGAKGFESLRNIASFITRRFGTSFRNSSLVNADFSGSKIHNADFSNADVSSVNWGDSKRINCIPLGKGQ